MFLAIISGTYSQVKTELAMAPPEMHMMEFVSHVYFKFINKIGLYKFLVKKPKTEVNVLIEEIQTVFKKYYDCFSFYLCYILNDFRCEFTDAEIEKFFEKYNIDTTELKLGPAELREHLLKIDQDLAVKRG